MRKEIWIGIEVVQHPAFVSDRPNWDVKSTEGFSKVTGRIVRRFESSEAAAAWQTENRDRVSIFPLSKIRNYNRRQQINYLARKREASRVRRGSHRSSD